MLAFAMSVALAVATAPALPSTPTRPAAEAAEAALAHYEAGRYDEARAEIERAYRIEPWPEYLFARAQIERADDDCVAARKYYNLYLEAGPPERGAKLAREGIEGCPVGPPPPPRVDAALEDARRDRVVRNVGIAVTATGGVALVTAAALYIAGAVQRRAAEDSNAHGVFGDHIDRARRLGVAGTAMVSIGAILTTAGVVQIVLATRRSRGATASHGTRRTASRD